MDKYIPIGVAREGWDAAEIDMGFGIEVNREADIGFDWFLSTETLNASEAVGG